MMLKEAVRILHEHELDLRAHHVKALSIFGSVARGEAREDSDVDILVEFDRRVGLLAFVGLKLYLEQILGRPVDLVTPSGLKSSMRESILREAVRAA
jgi:predicted nucleotidyltransferase